MRDHTLLGSPPKEMFHWSRYLIFFIDVEGFKVLELGSLANYLTCLFKFLTKFSTAFTCKDLTNVWAYIFFVACGMDLYAKQYLSF